jgi:DNA polymerase bacteriophage-type
MVMFEGERALGATFEPSRIGWIDFETRGLADLKAAGAYRYSLDAIPIICSYAIGDGPVKKITRWQGLRWRDMPEDFHAHHFDVRQGNTVWAAWNAGFDKAIWNFSSDFHVMEPEHIIDAQCQAAANGFPADLKWASRLAGGTRKDDAGRDLIILFCLPDSTATPETHPQEWQEFLDYAGDDVRAMRDIFRRTRQLSLAEWKEYWAMERINERGAPIDLSMVRTAAALADADRIRSSHDLRQLTGGAVTTVDQVARMVEWLRHVLKDDAAALKMLTRRDAEVDDDGVETRPAKFQLTRRRVEKLLVWCRAERETYPDDDELQAAERLLQIRLYGGSKTPAKFSKMLAQHVDGTLFGQYTFNGAGQTGRASSRGVQVHNLARDTLDYEYEAIEALLANASYDRFAELGDDTPVSRKLSLLIRPAFVPDPGSVFVWSDWSQIEARVLPWLAGDDPGALARLKIFSDVDRNPNLPDLYTRTAATLSHVPIEQVTKAMRQRGKVAELALGFGGGLGALQAMAAGYGLYLEDAEAKATVETWRKANDWCVRFWGHHIAGDSEGDLRSSEGLWGAIYRAMAVPGVPQQAGRISYVFQQGWLPGDYHGSLLCVLPSGRILTYRDLRSELVDELDEDDVVIGQSRKLRFSRGLSRVHFWHGLATENVVQAVAADFLRGTLRRLVVAGHDVRLHTHDEILLQAKDEQADIAQRVHDLRFAMREGFDWSQGLPLMSEERVEPYYTKQEA